MFWNCRPETVFLFGLVGSLNLPLRGGSAEKARRLETDFEFYISSAFVTCQRSRGRIAAKGGVNK